MAYETERKNTIGKEEPAADAKSELFEDWTEKVSFGLVCVCACAEQQNRLIIKTIRPKDKLNESIR